jgi:Tfp pilus assembly protein PilF
VTTGELILSESLTALMAAVAAGEPLLRSATSGETVLQVKGEMLHMLGVKSLADRDSVRAVMLLERALMCAPSDAAVLNNLGTALLAAGNTADAATRLRTATLLAGEIAKVHSNLGIVLYRLGDRDAAAESLRRAIALAPEYARARLVLSEVLSEQGNSSEAESLLRGILAFERGNTDVLLRIGKLLAARRRWEEATECLDSILLSQPSNLEALCALVTVIDDSRVDEVTARLKLAAPAADDEDMQLCVHRALASLAHLRRDVVAEMEHLQQALVYRPDAVDVRVDLAKLYLLTGDFASGWPAFEWRWRQAPGRLRPRGLRHPRWQGEPLGNSGIVLHAEQGFGSIIQFSRYAPLLARLGGRVVLEIPAELVRLMGSLEGIETVVKRGEPLPTVAWQCPLMSLPLAFQGTLETIPAEVPYLHADPLEARRWSQRLPAGFRVGIAWSGSPWHYNDRRRSLSADLLAPLGDVVNTSFIGLEHRPSERAKGPAFPYVDLSFELTDFADTAAVVANLDLLITVDTAVAHLAGAMGKPVWIMLPFAAEYRWLLERDDSPWYPTARLFRQPSPGDWRLVVARVAQELRRTIAGAIEC